MTDRMIRGCRLKIVNTTVALGGRVGTARIEVRLPQISYDYALILNMTNV